MKKTVFIIEDEEAIIYRNTLISVRKRLIKAFESTDDMSLRKWVNTHGPIIDDLLEELGHRFRGR